MRYSFHSILKSNRVLFQRLWHALAILLVLVSNIGTLAATTPVSAKSVAESKPQQQKPANVYQPVKFSHPVARTAMRSRNTNPAIAPSDPTLNWNTFLGGSGVDRAWGVATDGNGNIYVVGSSGATWGSPIRPYSSNYYSYYKDAFVAKLDSNGVLQWNTFLGTNMDDDGYSIAVDSNGNVYVVGRSYASWGSPVRAYSGVSGDNDAFVAKLNPNGELEWNTFLGSQWGDWGGAIAVDRSGNVYVAGSSDGTWSSPVHDHTDSYGDVFAAKLNNSGVLVWNTFLGGSGDDWTESKTIAVDGSGNVYVAGTSNATWGLPLRAYNADGYDNAFVAKLDSGGVLLWNTFIGGRDDWSSGITLDGSGNVYVTGASSFTWGSPIHAFTDGGQRVDDAFVAKLNSNGGLQWNTFLGGSGSDTGSGLAVDRKGYIYVGGHSTASWGTPTQAFTNGSHGWEHDAFAAKLNSSGALQFNTFLGSSGDDYGYATAVDGNGNLYITGMSGADAFVVKLAAGNTFNPGSDLFDGSVSNMGDIKSTGSVVGGERETGVSTSSCGDTQGKCGDPINTRTGVFSLGLPDLAFPTSAGNLIFQRAYSSGAADQAAGSLGYGWVHNQEARLIFPADLGGMQGYILFQGVLGNQHLFKIEADGQYTPGPGVLASLTKSSSTPVTYSVVTAGQERFEFDENGTLLTRADAQGNSFNYTYESGRLTRVSADQGTRYFDLAYDSQGRIVSVSDYAGRQVTYAYNAAGDLVTSTNLLGQVWTYAYDSSHHMTQVVDPSGKETVTTEYDASGKATRQYDGSGQLLVSLTYNADGSSTITDASGKAETHTYNEHNVVTQIADPADGGLTKTYDANFRPTTITDVKNNQTSYTWSADGANLTSVTNAAGRQTSISYDSLNNPVSMVDSSNHLTTYQYNGKLLTKTIDVLNGETSYTYTPKGYLASTTDPLGRTSSYTYDVHGQRVSMTDPSGQTWTYAYDNLGRLTDTTDPLGRVSHSEYDVAGRLLKSVRNYVPSRPQNDENLYNITTTYQYDVRGNQVAITDTYDHTTHYEYDDADRLVKTTDSGGNETINTYNAAGQLGATTDALGRTTHYEYDNSGRQTAVIDPAGNATHTAYNPDGTIASSTDVLGNVTSYTYDSLKRITAVTDAQGQVTSTTYDATGNVASTIDALGKVTTYEYDALGRQIKQTDPLGGVTETFYDAVGNRIQTIDTRGKATTYGYDSIGRLVSVTDALGNVTRTEYDSLGRRSASIDAAGHRTTYTYDKLDRVIAITDSQGHATTTIYDALGKVLSSTAPGSGTTFFTYDALYRQVGQTDALGATTTFAYDAVGNRISVTAPNEGTITTQFDLLNRPVQVTDALGKITITNYDAAGRMLSTTDALGKTTSYGYDSLGRQTSVTDPLGNVSASAYDAAGRLLSATAANGVVTGYEYDDLGRLTAVIENYRPGFTPDKEINVRTEYTYDANGNRLTITDGNGHTTHFTYDDLNRLLSETDPLGHTWQYAYDALGNRTQMTDANGTITTYAYNPANQLTALDLPGTGLDVSYVYDSVARRTGMTDGIGTTTWQYDILSRPTSITDPFGKSVGYTYDTMGNRSGLTYPDGKNVSYAYDASNHLTQVTSWNNQATQYIYDPLGRLQGNPRPNGVNSIYTYDDAGRLTQLQHITQADTLSSFQYQYDQVGNRTQAIENVQLPVTPPSLNVTVSVKDTDGAPKSGLRVYAFDGTTSTGKSAVTNANGEALFTTLQGGYRFRVTYNGTQFWSGENNHCTVPGCTSASITVTKPVTVTVLDTDGAPQSGVRVYAFEGTTSAGKSALTDANGQAVLTLLQSSYRFRVTYSGTLFWSGAANHCAIPGCTSASITVTKPVTVTVLDTDGAPQSGIRVYAFDGTTSTGRSALTNASGQVTLTLPQGSYRFRTDLNGTQFWSGAANHCTVPGCTDTFITVTKPVTVTVLDTDGAPQSGLIVNTYDGATSIGKNATTNANGQAVLSLLQGSYRFRVTYNGTQFWSGDTDHCTIPGCTSASIIVTKPVTVTVLDTDGIPQSGIRVYAFDGTISTGKSAFTDANGQAVLRLLEGNYRFRVTYSGTQFWSGEANHCAIPGCTSASITVTKSVTVAVQDIDGASQAGLKVYAYDGTTSTGKVATTDTNGQAAFILPEGSYRFRADLNGTQFWSGAANHCTIPGCTSASITVTKPVTVTVRDASASLLAGVKVYVYDGTTYAGKTVTTDANGQAVFTLQQGSYRFRADYGGLRYWSATTNNCAIPGCTILSMTVGPQAYQPDELNMAASTGWHRTYALVRRPTSQQSSGTDTTLEAQTLPAEPASAPATSSSPVTILYTYDSLNRLTKAAYSNGRVYEYTYDAVGNRLSQTITINGQPSIVVYEYDAANRLISVNGVIYSYDNNGNLLSDGTNTYTYDSANRLSAVHGPSFTASYRYNGLGDRLQETVNGTTTTFSMDLNSGLPQVLSDGTYNYLYGNGRIAQVSLTPDTGTSEYFLGDALGSVRQLTGANGAVTLAKSYDPYGTVAMASGTGSSSYGFTGEQQDSNGMVYLRSRYYGTTTGRFLSRDTWQGNYNRPASLNKWNYVEGNPVNLTDPSGQFPEWCKTRTSRVDYENCVRSHYGLSAPKDYPVIPWSQFTGGWPGCWSGPVAYKAPGYLEGSSFTGAAIIGMTYATENVYDFATMERGKFLTTSLSLTPDLLNVSGMQYHGLIDNFNNIDGIEQQYSGDFYFVSGGISTGIPTPLVVGLKVGVGVGATKFWAPSGEVNGYSLYYSLGAGVSLIEIINAAGGVSTSTLAGNSRPPKRYFRSMYHNVDIGSLINDISYDSLLLPVASAGLKAFAIGSASHYAWIHDEIYIRSKTGY